MKKKIVTIIFFFLILIQFLCGCDQIDFNINPHNNNNNQNVKEGCIAPLEVEQLESDFLQMRSNLSDYLSNTEFVMENYSNTSQRGILTEKGRSMRIEYEELREQYLEVMYDKCEKTNGLPITSNVWLKGYDLIKFEIHPEYFLDLPISSKSRIIYEEPEYWTGETTRYLEFRYYKQISEYSVAAKIEATHVGTVQDQWQWLADEQGFKTASYKPGEPTGSTVYFTNNYTDDYGWKHKGIFFQIYGFMVYAGYYNWGDYVGTDIEYFQDIEITEDTAKDIYEDLVFRPGYNSDL